MEVSTLMYEVIQTSSENGALPFGLRRSGGGYESMEMTDLTDSEEKVSLLARLYACGPLLPEYFESLTESLVGVLL